ncbi:MAG: response regulator [Nitrospira sp.]
MIKKSRPSYDDFVRDNADLRARLEVAEDTLQAIRTGGVDALAVTGPKGVKIYTIEGADHPYRLFVESMCEGAVTIDRQGTLVYANQTFADLIGQILGKTVGTQFIHCVQPSDRPQFEKLLRESHSQNRRPELSLLHRTGESIPVQLSARPTSLQSGEFYCLVVTDLREQRVRERELHQSHARLRALANELNVAEQRERTRLAGELHDYLAQLLVVLRMKLRQMAPLVTSGKAETLLKEADHILTQSLDYTRSLVAELAPPALHDFGLTQALAWLASQMQQHGLHVRLTSQQDVLAIPEDQAMLLFQSVRELLFNVLKHAQVKQATVSVSITPNHELHLSVTDEGCGFELNRIQQTDPKRFGLFSLRERLAAMGGRFELHSTVGQGTQALLVTPYWPAPSMVSSQGPVANGKPSQSGRERSEEDAEHGPGHSPAMPHPVPHIRVLLVDDHAMVRQGLCSVLKEYEDVVVAGEACNGAEALDQVEALHPSVVVMDINMPKMNGIQATAVIKARHPDISVIGLSVQAGGLNEEAMKQAGAVTLLTKEAAVDELYSAIQAALADRRPLGVQ